MLETIQHLLTELVASASASGGRVIFCLETNCQIICSVGEKGKTLEDLLVHCQKPTDFSYVDKDQVSVRGIPLFHVAAQQYYVLVLYSASDSWAWDSHQAAELLSALRVMLVEYTVTRYKSEHEFAINTITGLIEGLTGSNVFRNQLSFIVSLFNYTAGSIWSYHDNSDFGDPAYLTLEATVRHPMESYQTRCLRAGRGVVWRALQPNAPKYLHVARVDENELVNKGAVAELYARPVCFIRLEAEGKVYGVACLNGVDGLHDSSMDALGAFEKLVCLEMVNRRYERTAALLQKTTALLPREGLTVEEVCARVAEGVRKIIPCQACSVFLREDAPPPTHCLELKAVTYDEALGPSSQTEGFKKKGQAISYDIRVKSLTGLVFNSAKPQLANEALKRPECSDYYREISDRSNDTWIGVPIVGQRQPCIGVIRCTGRQTTIGNQTVAHIFDSDDCNVLRHFAAVVGPVIEMVHSLKLLERWNEQLATAERIREHEMLGPLSSIAANADFVREHLHDTGYNREQRLKNIVSDTRMCSFFVTRSMVGREEEINRDRRYISLNAIFSRLRDFLIRQIYIRSHMQIVHADYARELKYLVTPFMKVRLTGSAPNTVAHEMLLQRAFFNIAANAIKYGKPPHGYLHMRLLDDYGHDQVSIDFEDNGIGIEEDECDKIFEEGFRGREVRGTQYPGSGLGLHIARQIITLHGGTITLLSCRKPTKFRVILPVIKPQGASDLSAVRPELIRNDKAKRIVR